MNLELLWDEGQIPSLLYCKGHLGVDEFQAALRDWCLSEHEDIELWDEYELKHGYGRWIPYPNHDDPFNSSAMRVFDKPGRGAFPISYIELEP